MLIYSFQILILNFGNQSQFDHTCCDLEIDVMSDRSHIWMMNAGNHDDPYIIGNICVCMCVRLRETKVYWEREEGEANIFRITVPLCGEFTGHRWIPRTKAIDAELLCFIWSAPWINGWVNNREAGDLWRHRAHYDVIVMFYWTAWSSLMCHGSLYI